MAQSVERLSYSDIDLCWTYGRLICLLGGLSFASRISRRHELKGTAWLTRRDRQSSVLTMTGPFSTS